MKIAFYEIADWEAEYIQARLTGHELEFYASPFSDQDLPGPDVEILSTFIGSPITPKVLGHCPKLRLVATRTTGYDHINVEACSQKGIAVSNVPSYGENTVAEFTFAILLALTRKLYPSIKRVREEGWFNFEGLRGWDLKGKTLGVVGTGRIGTYVIKIANGFGMNVVAYDPYPNEKNAQALNFEYVTLEDLLKESDIVTLQVPYMPSTHHLINKGNINLLKPGRILVNTARGGLVETAALVEALKSGHIVGAALDVIEEEGFLKDELNLLTQGHPNEQQLKTALADHELMHMENVIITPHNAFNTIEALKRILDTTIQNIDAFVHGKPTNVVKS